MAQVAIQATPTSGIWSSTATPTLDVPACTDTHQQLLIVTFTNGATVSAPTISGWEKAEAYIAGEQNRMAIYKRAPTGGASAGTVSPTFSGACSGRYWCGSINGVIPTLSLTTEATWTNPKPVAATSAADNESLHLVSMTSSFYPRKVGAVSGYTEVHDSWGYAGSGGLWIGLLSKDVSSGAVAATEWPLTDEADVSTGSRVGIMNLVVGPLPAGGSGEGTITIDADFPLPAIAISRAGSGALAVGASDTVTVSVVDQNGGPMRNVTVSVGVASGGVYTNTTPAVTNSSGVTTFTITGAAAGVAALIVSAGSAYSNELSIEVQQAASNKVRRRRNRIWG